MKVLLIVFALGVVASANAQCDEGWNEYNGRCFRPIAASMDRTGYMFHHEAVNVCAEYDAGLPSIHSLQDEIFMESQLRIVQQTSSSPGLWLGGRITDAYDLTPIWTDYTRSDFQNFNTRAIETGYFRVFPTYRCLVFLDPNSTYGEGSWDIGNCENSGTPYGVVCAKNAN